MLTFNSMPCLRRQGRTHALVEQVDLFPTLVQAATMHVSGGPTILPHCPGDTAQSRSTALCTEGFSLIPLISNATGGRWPRAAFSQFARGTSCCDCPDPESNPCCPCKGVGVSKGVHDHPIMGYTVRVDRYRYTAWVGFDQTTAEPDWNATVATELYAHHEENYPIDFGVEHTNVIHDPANKAVVAQLDKVLRQCGPRPDLCPPALLAGLVH